VGITKRYTLDLLRKKEPYISANGSELPGVTTIIGQLDKAALMPWAAKVEREGVLAAIRRGEEPQKAYYYTSLRDAAANKGTAAHAMIEAALRGWEFDPGDTDPAIIEAARPRAERYLAWMAERGEQAEAVELKMVSESYRCGGTVDHTILTSDGRRVLRDVKTSKSIWESHKIQVAAYAAMHEELHGPVDACEIVWLPEAARDFDPDKHIVTLSERERIAGRDIFEALVLVWRHMVVFK